jgi:hypothetical protein
VSEISEAAMKKAETLVPYSATSAEVEAVARFVQAVSDAAKEVFAAHDHYSCTCTDRGPLKQVLAPFILPDPVDPLLIEARKVAADVFHDHRYQGAPFEKGGFDEHPEVQIALEALKRGMELARETVK